MISALEAAAANPDSAKYGRVEGDWELRCAYGRHLGAIYGHEISPLEIHITSGCNQAFVAAVLAVAGQNDEILMTRPCYFNHESTLGMLGIGIGYVDCEASNGMLPRIEDIAAAIGPRTRAIAIVSPNNPCGSIYPSALLDAIFSLCRERGSYTHLTLPTKA